MEASDELLCDYVEWEQFLGLAEKTLRLSDAIDSTEPTENTLHHCIALAKQFLSGLLSVLSLFQ